MKKLVVLMLSVLLFLVACKNEEEKDNCKEDRIDGKWQDVIDSSQCSKGEKGEAYLGLANFDYFDLIRYKDSKNITQILGLSSSNWASRLNSYKNAAGIVRSSYKKGDDREKTVFFFGSFLSMYTDMSGNLDNGDDGAATAFDGTITAGEIEKFSGVTQNASGGNTDVTISTTDHYQIKSGNSYYIYDESDELMYNDAEADGLKDGAATAHSDVEKAALISSATEVNQVVQIDKIADPLAGAISDPNIVIDFSNSLLSYLDDIQDALTSLDIKNDSKLVEPIIEFRKDIDNGGQCETVKNFPALSLANLFVANTQKTVLTDYRSTNKVSVDDIRNLYPSFDSTNLPGISVPLGVKLVYKADAGGSTPHWDASEDPEILDAMTSLELIGTTDVEKLDGKVSYTELACVPDLVGKD